MRFLDVFLDPVVKLVELDSLLQSSLEHLGIVFVFHSLAIIHQRQIGFDRVENAPKELLFVDGRLFRHLYRQLVVVILK